MISPAVAELEQALRQLLRPASKRILIGFSGGLDSTALLLLASRVVKASQLTALHINHNLQPAAPEWEAHCHKQARALGVECISMSVSPYSSSENSAREARYQAFESQLNDGDFLLLGHHQDDQAETILMRLFRGSGVKGLAGMPQTRALGRGFILRPLLATPRTTLESLVRDAGLSWIEDPSNQSRAYLRNWIRHELAPVLAQRWPDWNVRLSETAQHMSDASKLHQTLALNDAGGRFANPLRLSETLLSAPERLANLIYYWLESQAVHVGSSAQVTDLVNSVCRGVLTGSWRFSTQSVHLYQQNLWLEPAAIPEQGRSKITLEPGLIDLAYGQLQMQIADIGLRPGIRVDVRARQSGDKLQLEAGHQSVKKFMNDRKIPPWLRDSWPLLVLEGEIISIVGIWDSKALRQQAGIKLKWLR